MHSEHESLNIVILVPVKQKSFHSFHGIEWQRVYVLFSPAEHIHNHFHTIKSAAKHLTKHIVIWIWSKRWTGKQKWGKKERKAI